MRVPARLLVWLLVLSISATPLGCARPHVELYKEVSREIPDDACGRFDCQRRYLEHVCACEEAKHCELDEGLRAVSMALAIPDEGAYAYARSELASITGKMLAPATDELERSKLALAWYGEGEGSTYFTGSEDPYVRMAAFFYLGVLGMMAGEHGKAWHNLRQAAHEDRREDKDVAFELDCYLAPLLEGIAERYCGETPVDTEPPERPPERPAEQPAEGSADGDEELGPEDTEIGPAFTRAQRAFSFRQRLPLLQKTFYVALREETLGSPNRKDHERLDALFPLVYQYLPSSLAEYCFGGEGEAEVGESLIRAVDKAFRDAHLEVHDYARRSSEVRTHRSEKIRGVVPGGSGESESSQRVDKLDKPEDLYPQAHRLLKHYSDDLERNIPPRSKGVEEAARAELERIGNLFSSEEEDEEDAGIGKGPGEDPGPVFGELAGVLVTKSLSAFQGNRPDDKDRFMRVSVHEDLEAFKKKVFEMLAKHRAEDVERVTQKEKLFAELIQRCGNPEVNTFILYQVGQGPYRTRHDRYGQTIRINPRPCPTKRVVAELRPAGAPPDALPLAAMAWPGESWTYQATTRGGREIDHIREGKAEFRDTLRASSTLAAGLASGAVVAAMAAAAAGAVVTTTTTTVVYSVSATGSVTVSAQTTTSTTTSASAALSAAAPYLVAAGALMGVWYVAKRVADNVHPEGDVRGWHELPSSIYLVAAALEPGDYEASMRGFDVLGRPTEEPQSSFRFTVAAEGPTVVLAGTPWYGSDMKMPESGERKGEAQWAMSTE